MAINCSRQCPRCGCQVSDPRQVRCPRCRTLLVGSCQGQCRGCFISDKPSKEKAPEI